MTKYEQIANSIKNQIALKVYKEGDMIPPELELCRLYNVSRITVRQAVDILVRQKYLLRERGRGRGTRVLSASPESNDAKVRKHFNFGMLFKLEDLYSQKSDIPPIIHGIAGTLNIWEATLNTFPFDKHIDQVALFKSLLDRNLTDGFFLTDIGGYNAPVIGLLQEKSCPFIFLCPATAPELVAKITALGCNSVCIDERDCVDSLLERMAAANVRDIRLFGADSYMTERTGGLFSGSPLSKKFKTSVLKVDKSRGCFGQIRAALEKARGKNSLVVVSENGLLPYVDAAMEELMMSAPADVRILAFRHFAYYEPLLENKYSTIDRSFYDLGAEAARLMMSIVGGKSVKPQNITLKSSISNHNTL